MSQVSVFSRLPEAASASIWGGGATFAPLPPPAELAAESPLGPRRAASVARWRGEVRAVLEGADDRLLVIAGPCSVHDPRAAVDYACRLSLLADQHGRDLLVVMRAYFDKPRTVHGWKGLVNDPGMDGSHDIARGLRTARNVLLDIAEAGMPAACEWVDPLVPLYLADAVSWAAVGARTVESQLHRQLAAAMPMPVGFKNGTGGDVQAAVDACRAGGAAHVFLGADGGGPGTVTAPGNPGCHVVLRGGSSGPNYAAGHVENALALLGRAGLPRRVVVDAAHGNSGKDHARQPLVAADVAAQVAGGQDGLVGLMAESFLESGRQDPGRPWDLVYGKSVTDPCMDLEATAAVLGALAAAARARRAARGRR